MYKTIFNKRNSLKFNRFSNKNYSLFAVLGREVLVGALSVATLSHAKAAGVSTEGAKVDSTLYKGGKAYELDAVSVTGSRAPMTVEQSPKIVSVILLGHGCLNPVNHVGAVCVESANGYCKTSLAILSSHLEG